MIAVVDYGMGNLRSVSKALEHLGAEVAITSDPDCLRKADKVVLPGVGAFGDAVQELDVRGLREPLREIIISQKPFLGICLGLQLLFDESEESPGALGLGVFPGKVTLFRSTEVKVPHMGWNQISIVKKHPLLKDIEDKSYFYFVHSYYAPVIQSSVALCEYGEGAFSAAIGTSSLFAAQFHPEKSQSAGLQLLKNFVEWEV